MDRVYATRDLTDRSDVESVSKVGLEVRVMKRVRERTRCVEAWKEIECR